MQLWGGEERREKRWCRCGAIQSGNIYISIQARRVFICNFHWAVAPSKLKSSRAAFEQSLCCFSARRVWSRPLFHIRTKIVMNNSPRAVSLRVTKVAGRLAAVGTGGGLCVSGKRVSDHWLRVGALSRSAGVAPVATAVATSVIKAHVRSSYFIKKKEADADGAAEGKAVKASTTKTVYSGESSCFKLASFRRATGGN